MHLMRFLRDRRGSIAPVIAGAAIPIMSLTGAAVDYSRANSMKASLQSALDSSALAMTRNAMTATPEQFTTDATADVFSVFDGEQRQDGCAENRDPQSPQPVAGNRLPTRRRLRVDHPI